MRLLLNLLTAQLACSGEVLHYKFWLTYGQGFKDFSGNGRHAVSGSNTAINTDDVSQTARGIYVDNDQVLAPPNDIVSSGFLNGMRYSMTVWTLPLRQENVIMDRIGVSSLYIRWRMLQISGVNLMRLRIFSNEIGDQYADGNVDIPIGKWLFLTLVIDCFTGTNCVITGYNSLGVVSSNTLPVAYTGAEGLTDTTVIACISKGFYYEFVVYDYPLTTTDIATLLQTAGTGACPGSCTSPCVLSPAVLCLSPCPSIFATQDCFQSCNCGGSTGCVGNDPNNCMTCNGSCTHAICYGTTYTECLLGQTCDPQCATCSDAGSNACLTCKANAIQYTSPGACTCAAGHFGTADNCQQCHANCATCENVNSNGCLSCYSNAQLEGPAPTSCVCLPGTFPSPDAANCQPCSSLCVLCQSSNICAVCSSDANRTSTGQCECVSGYYEEAGACQHCPLLCSTCVAASRCNSCGTHAELHQTTMCKCSNGYYLNQEKCTACAKDCQSCISEIVCLMCQVPALLLNYTCYQRCPAQYSSNATHCLFTPEPPPYPSLTVSINNTLSISFSKNISKSTASESDVAVAVVDLDLQDYPVHWSVTQVAKHNAFNIALDFRNSTLPPDRSQAKVVFVQPADFTDSRGTPINVTTLNGILNPFPKPEQPYTGIYQNTSAAQTAAAVSQGAVAFASLASIISGSPGAVWSLLNQLQLLAYIPLSTVDLPEELAGTLAALNFNSFLSNPFSYLFNGDQTAFQSPDFAYLYGYSSTLFLLNSGLLVAAAVLTVGSLVPIWLLSKVKLPFIAAYFQLLVPRYRWGVFIRYWIQVYLDLGLASMLQFYSFPVEVASIAGGINYSLAFLTLFAFTLTPITLIRFTLKNKRLVLSRSDEAFNAKWEELYKYFDPEKPLIFHFYSLYFGQRLLFAAILILLPSQPGIQALLMASSEAAVRK